jgi:predicted acetyltransferase
VTDEITMRTAVADDWDAIYAMVAGAFNSDGDDDASAAERPLFEPDRCRLAIRSGQIVGSAGVLTRHLAVPGATVPAGHVSMIAVSPTARRQGLLTRFIGHQFTDIRTAGEPIAVLWATEGRIYQRYGYACATRRMSLTVDTREVRLTNTAQPTRSATLAEPTNIAESGRLIAAAPADLRDTLTKVYEHAYAERPGWSERAPNHWDNRLADPKSRRGGSALRAVVHEGVHGPDGYALWRVRSSWDDSGPAGEVQLVEHVTTSPEAYAALWEFILGMDLTRTATAWACALDEPLFFMVNEPRRLAGKIADALWLRIIDLPAALAARRYATNVDLVFEVTDDVLPGNAGRWRLTGSPEAATCTSTMDEPDLACDIRQLAAAYLGDAPLAGFAAAGLVRELRPGAADLASTAFGWHRLPSSIEVF